MKRLWLVVALAACAGKKDAPVEPAVTAPFPRVADSSAILPLAKTPRPTHVVWIDAGGALEIAPADRVWTGGLPTARKPAADLDALAAIAIPDEAAVADPWSSSPGRSVAKEAERGFQRAPAAIGMRDIDEPHVLVLASPSVDALRTVRVIRRVGGRFGVALPRAELGALRFVFRSDAIGSTVDETRPWVEMHLGSGGIDVLSLPSHGRARVAWGKSAAEELRAIAKSFGREPPKLDVFVGAGVTHQQLVDTLVALDGAGVTTLFLGSSPGPADGRHDAITQAAVAQRGAMSETAIVVLGQPSAQGDLERTEIKRVVRQQAPALLACYDAQLAKQPELRGTVSTQFFITPMGTVAASSASGVDATVATCVADVIKTVEFPKPKGGGGVQVSYPFTFRPRET